MFMNWLTRTAALLLAALAVTVNATCPTSRTKDSAHCLECISHQDTSGWVNTGCQYCPSSGQCSGSIYDSCYADWIDNDSSCSGVASGHRRTEVKRSHARPPPYNSLPRTREGCVSNGADKFSVGPLLSLEVAVPR
jgi:hypothetical protein